MSIVMTNEQLNRIWLIMSEINRQNRYINQRIKYRNTMDENEKQLLKRQLEWLARTIEDKKFLQENPI